MRKALGVPPPEGTLVHLPSEPSYVGAAIAAIHREPAGRWTVAALALEVGKLRSGFAARFGQLVCDGPIEYLTRWWMLLAGRGPACGDPIGATASSLGYESESAFTTCLQGRLLVQTRDELGVTESMAAGVSLESKARLRSVVA
jgi:AraC-like DNA-binding protein